MVVDLPIRSKKFGISIAQYYVSLKEKKYYEVASQLFRSGTSIGANIVEAQSAISKKEFIVKMQIALKE
ncbi:MAG: four helix bundle protein [bacterium]|nr:four helix bundle protein [bacterium]